jgi:hypothetical protein
MSTVCSGNPSVPNTGVATSIFIDSAYIKSLLPPALAYLYDFIPMIHGLEIGDVPTFCATDPPTLSLPSSADFFNFVTGGPIGAGQVVNEFLEDVARHYLWYAICHCTVVSTPAPPTPPADPGDLPAINPSDIVTLPGVTPCATTTHDPNIQWCGGNNPGITNPLAIGGANVTGVRISVRRYASTGAGFPATFDMAWYNNVALLRADRFSVPNGNGTTVVVLGGPPSGAISGQVIATGTGSGCVNFDVTLEYFCSGDTPGSTQTPCCPPDPALTGYLQQILQAVTLLQRQTAPFAYVYGTNHTGLSGDGEISVQGLLGISVDVTTLPSRAGSESGTPETLFDIGFVSLGTDDGWITSRRFDHDGTLFLPPLGGLYTRVGYTVPADVEIAIRELVREP